MPAASEVTLPEALRAALASAPEAEAYFHRLPPSHRRKYVSYIEEAKQEATRARRAEKTVAMLLQKRDARG